MNVLKTSKDYLDEDFEMLTPAEEPLTQDQVQEIKSIVDLIAVGVLKSLQEAVSEAPKS